MPKGIPKNGINKGWFKKGVVPKTAFKKGQTLGEKNYWWKDDKAGYFTIHSWIARNYGSPKKCFHCETTTANKFEWANISGKYIRNIDDFVRLCTRCHRRFDMKTHCIRGHKYTTKNTYINSQGGRSCKKCKKLLLQTRGEF